jgi:hypothetical protein
MGRLELWTQKYYYILFYLFLARLYWLAFIRQYGIHSLGIATMPIRRAVRRWTARGGREGFANLDLAAFDKLIKRTEGS